MSSNGYFAGKTAAITGAASGIGRALAIQLADAGCSVALADIDEVGSLETARMLKDKHVLATTHPVDVAERQQMERFANEVMEQHGKVDIVINNAGVTLAALMEYVTYEDLEWLLGINLWGTIYGAKAFLPYLKQRPQAHIVNLSSVNGLFTNPRFGAYCISKFAVRAFTQVLDQELRRTSVTVSCVHPGGVKTNLVHNARFRTGKDPVRAKQQSIQFFERYMAWTTPERAAKVILAGIRKKKRRILIGPDAQLYAIFLRLCPNIWHSLMAHV